MFNPHTVTYTYGLLCVLLATLFCQRGQCNRNSCRRNLYAGKGEPSAPLSAQKLMMPTRTVRKRRGKTRMSKSKLLEEQGAGAQEELDVSTGTGSCVARLDMSMRSVMSLSAGAAEPTNLRCTCVS